MGFNLQSDMKHISTDLAVAPAASKLSGSYGTAQFKLHTRVCITRVYLVTPVEHF